MIINFDPASSEISGKTVIDFQPAGAREFFFILFTK